MYTDGEASGSTIVSVRLVEAENLEASVQFFLLDESHWDYGEY